MSDAFTSAGTIIEVADELPATYDDTGFAALTWDEVGEVTNLGDFGRIYQLVTHNPLKDRRTVKRKGSYDDGSVTIQAARVDADAGQVILDTYLDSDDSLSVKVTLQDDTVLYFTAQVMSKPTSVGGVNQITSISCELAIDNDIILGA